MLELALLGIFVASAGYTALMVWRKVPLLLQVPDQLINESFVTRPSRLKNYLDPAVAFFRDAEYRDLYYYLLIETLAALRLRLLRWERKTFQLLEKIQKRNREWTERSEGYLSELNQWKEALRENGGANIPKAVFHPEAPPDVAARKPRRRKAVAKVADKSDTAAV